MWLEAQYEEAEKERGGRAGWTSELKTDRM